MWTLPESSWSAIVIASPTSPRMPIDRPYSLPLARATASSTVENFITGATGPKISSFHAGLATSRSARTVGAVEQAVVRAAGGQPCPALHRVLDDRVDPVQLFLVDDRAQRHRPARRVADGKMVRLLREGATYSS